MMLFLGAAGYITSYVKRITNVAKSNCGARI